jgi:hypothetical protein
MKASRRGRSQEREDLKSSASARSDDFNCRFDLQTTAPTLVIIGQTGWCVCVAGGRQALISRLVKGVPRARRYIDEASMTQLRYRVGYSSW